MQEACQHGERHNTHENYSKSKELGDGLAVMAELNSLYLPIFAHDGYNF